MDLVKLENMSKTYQTDTVTVQALKRIRVTLESGKFIPLLRASGLPLRVIPTQVLFDVQGRSFTPSEALQIEFNMYKLKDTNEHVFTTHEGGLDKTQMLAILKEMGLK